MANVSAPSPARQVKPPVRPVKKPRQPRPKPQHHARLSAPVPGSDYRIMDIADGRGLTCYFVLPLPSDFGSCYRLEKFTCHRRGDEPSSYDVCLGEGHTSCECWLRWGHCRHLEALVALGRAGKLPLPVDLGGRVSYKPGRSSDLPF
jgi:hypothetical protein